MNKNFPKLVRKMAGQLPASEMAQSAVNLLLDSDVLEELPLVSVVVALHKGVQKQKLENFQEKVRAFASTAGSFTKGEMEAFSSKLEADGNKDKYLNELLIELERTDSEEKALIFGVIFRRFVQLELSYLQFQYQIRYTRNLSTEDIAGLVSFSNKNLILDEGLGDALLIQKIAKRKFRIRTVKLSEHESAPEPEVEVTFSLTSLGKLYLETLHEVFCDSESQPSSSTSPCAHSSRE